MGSDSNSSPDMVKYAEVISVITIHSKCFKDQNAMADMIRHISSLERYDLNPVSDNITNNTTTVNVIAEDSKVRDFLANMRVGLEKGQR